MVRAFVAVGSNIDPGVNLKDAVHLLKAHALIAGLSTVYRTKPIGRPEQGQFYNCVVEVRTNLEPVKFKLGVLRNIEAQLGRERTPDKYAARTIDLDLLIYDDLVFQGEELVLPDPDISRRFFIAAPLAELAPELVLPGSNIPVSQLAAALPVNGAEPLTAYTAQLRKELGI